MSTSYYAVAGIGVLVDFDLLDIEETEASCPHPQARGNSFCPVYGKAVIEASANLETLFESVRDDLEDVLPEKYIVSVFDHYNKELFIGWGTIVGEYRKIVDMSGPIPSHEEILKTITEALGDDAEIVLANAEIGFLTGLLIS